MQTRSSKNEKRDQQEKNRKNLGLSCLGCFGIFFIMIFIVAAVSSLSGEANQKEKTETVKSTQSTEKKEFIMNEVQQKAFDNLNDFNLFVESYKEIPVQERTEFWDNKLYDQKVTWTGTIMEIGGNRLFVIDSDKYPEVEGLTYAYIGGTENDYYLFVAQFDNKLIKSNYEVGQQATFTGKLQSRGSDGQSQYEKQPGTFAHWKIYNAVQE